MRYDKGLGRGFRDGGRPADFPRKGFRRKKACPDVRNRSPGFFFVFDSEVIDFSIGYPLYLIKFKHSLLIDEDVSEAYLKKNGLRLGIYSIWRSFVELDQQLRSTEVTNLDIGSKSTVGLN